MGQILQFLVSFCSFLWTEARYRIVDSEVTTTNGGDALLLVASTNLRMRFVRDRGQLFLDLRATGPDQDGEWYGIDLLRRLLTGERQDTAELDEGYAEFLRSHLAEIESRLADPDRLPQTRERLRELRRLRSKETSGRS